MSSGSLNRPQDCSNQAMLIPVEDDVLIGDAVKLHM